MTEAFWIVYTSKPQTSTVTYSSNTRYESYEAAVEAASKIIGNGAFSDLTILKAIARVQRETPPVKITPIT